MVSLWFVPLALFAVVLLIGIYQGRVVERRRVAALTLAVQSHGVAPGDESDRCFPARARVFEDYLKERRR